MILHPQNFSPYNPQQVGGGALTQAKPAQFIYPWIPNTPAGRGTQRTSPHERGTWFSHPIIRKGQAFFQDGGIGQLHPVVQAPPTYRRTRK